MKKPLHIPKTPGIYIFRDRQRAPLYIGKAGNLRSRLSFYFSRSPKSARSEKLLTEARALTIIKTASDIEALIAEAEHIKKYSPKYNVLMRDDKNYLYVAITREPFPKIYVTHQPRKREAGMPEQRTADYIGPFTDGTALKTTLRALRGVFPYCTCQKPHPRTCLNAEIGRCLGVCCKKPVTTDAMERRRYKKNIASIIGVLRGRGRFMMKAARRAMREAAQNEHFEKAAKFRDELFGLERVFAHAHVLSQSFRDIRKKAAFNMEQELSRLLGVRGTIVRLEGYDISNISGRDAVGSMVVFIKKNAGGPRNYYAPDKKSYRHFRIKTVSGANDPAMIREVLSRRLKHREWPRPDILVIDGGLAQLHAAMDVVHATAATAGSARPLVTALAKRKEELYSEEESAPIELKKQPEHLLHLFQNIRNESHRFAKRYHHKRRELAFKKN